MTLLWEEPRHTIVSGLLYGYCLFISGDIEMDKENIKKTRENTKTVINLDKRIPACIIITYSKVSAMQQIHDCECDEAFLPFGESAFCFLCEGRV